MPFSLKLSEFGGFMHHQVHQCTDDPSNHHALCALQLSFFSIVGIPLFKSMTDIFEETRPMLQGVMENYKAWEKDAAITSTPVASPRP